MSWLEDIQNNRKRQVEQMAKAFGYDTSTIQKAEDDGVDYTVDEEPEDETTNKSKDGDAYAGKSDMYKMRMLGLRKFNDQDQKDYIGVEDADSSYITNLDNGDIIISKTDNGYLVSKFPIDENNEGDEQEATDLSEAIKIALRFKEELENDEDEPEQIMYKEETDKAFDDEINPFEREAWEASLSKAELDKFEKAKHADGDMHPNGKWVWRSSANGGKGDWRVASPSKRGGGGTSKTTASTKTTTTDDKVQKFMDALKVVSNKYTDENKVSAIKTPKGNWDVSYDGHRVGTINSKFLTEKIAKEKGWLKDDTKKDNKPSTSITDKTLSKEKLDNSADGSVIKITNAQTGSPVITFTKKNGKWYGKNTMTRGEVQYGTDQVLNSVERYNKKTYSTKIDLTSSKNNNTITHDINGTKVTVTKNVDGSYTLEANGKKFKSDDPSFFVNGTNLKPSVKKALAKEVGLETNGKTSDDIFPEKISAGDTIRVKIKGGKYTIQHQYDKDDQYGKFRILQNNKQIGVIDYGVGAKFHGYDFDKSDKAYNGVKNFILTGKIK